MTDLEQLEQQRNQAYQRFCEANDRQRAAELEKIAALTDWSRARIAYARAKGHPLAGKHVRRAVGRYNGTVLLWEGEKQAFHIRNHQPIPGEWFIASASGQTGYHLAGDGSLRDGWKVVEDGQ